MEKPLLQEQNKCRVKTQEIKKVQPKPLTQGYQTYNIEHVRSLKCQ